MGNVCGANICSGPEPGDDIKQPVGKKQKTLIEQWGELSDFDPCDPPLPDGWYRKKIKGSQEKEYYYVDINGKRSDWRDPRIGRVPSPGNNAIGRLINDLYQ